MISLKVKKLKGVREKTFGLIFEKSAIPILIETRFGIHTFGMKFPVDVLVLDNSNKVVMLLENLKPNRIFIWNPKYNKVIELPINEIKKLKIKVGEIIRD